MKKVLSAEGIGERDFEENHAASLLNYPNSKWKFVRNHDPDRIENTGTAAKAKPSTKDGGSNIATGKDKDARKGLDSSKQRSETSK